MCDSSDSDQEYWDNVRIGIQPLNCSIHNVYNTIILCSSRNLLNCALNTRNCIQELKLRPGEFVRVIISRNNIRSDHFDIIFVDLRIRTQITDRTLFKLHSFYIQTDEFIDDQIVFSKNFYISGKMRNL